MDELRMGVPTIQGQETIVPAVQPIGEQQVLEFTKILNEYRAGKARTDSRIISAENWWKLRNSYEEQSESQIGKDGGFRNVSAWLHNVIVSKHADAMEAYPEPNILPREEGDAMEAQMLSSIVPVILEQNGFEKTYSNANWDKLQSGTCVYKVFWDPDKLNGIGDIAVEKVNLLNIFWEPGVEDVQKSRYFFHCEPVDKDVLVKQYPQLVGKIGGNMVLTSQYQTDDPVKNENKCTVVDVYYKLFNGRKKVLHFCKFVGDQVLFASENDPMYADRGLYDHGLYPYVLDALFPVKGTPCGYGFVDICRNPQISIDLMKTAFLKNAMVGATPRYFSRQEGAINEEEFLDLSKPVVHVNGSVADDFLRRVEHTSLDGNYMGLLEHDIRELRETSGNTETANGTTSSGVTAASAIAALQEASGKGSRDSTKSTYRAYRDIVNLCIELIRQFYDLPRQFRIIGEYGKQQFVTYHNAGIRPVHQGEAFGQDMGYRVPVFDVKVSAQKQSVYNKVAQNELAIQFFQMGFFNPQMVDQALMTIDMMDFDGKERIMQKIAKNGDLFQKLVQYMQLALGFAQKYEPAAAEQISMDIIGIMQGGAAVSVSAPNSKVQTDHIGGIMPREHGGVRNARERANEASQPDGGK